MISTERSKKIKIKILEKNIKKKEQKGLIQTCGKQVKEILYMLCLCLLLFETCIFFGRLAKKLKVTFIVDRMEERIINMAA